MEKIESSRTVAILGPGAVGGFLACVLMKEGIQTVCVAPRDDVERIKKDGILLKSEAYDDFRAYPYATTDLDVKPDILFVTVKQPYLKEAMERISPELLEHAVVIPLMNGFEHIAVLREKFGDRVAVGSISIEVMRDEEGAIRHLSPFARISIASDHDVSAERLQEIADFLTAAGIPTLVLTNEASVIWGKLVRLNAITLAIAASGEPIGAVRTSPEWRKKLEEAVGEATLIARSEGAPIDAAEVMRQIDALPETLRTSLSRDSAAENDSELDAIAGAVVRAGEQYGIPCPAIQEMMETIKRQSAH